MVVELLPHFPPFGTEAVHEAVETSIVPPFPKMRQLVEHDIFQAMQGVFCKLQVQPDASCLRIAGTPSGFHVPNAVFLGLLSHNCLAAIPEPLDGALELDAIPPMKQVTPFLCRAPLRRVKKKPFALPADCAMRLHKADGQGVFLSP